MKQHSILLAAFIFISLGCYAQNDTTIKHPYPWPEKKPKYIIRLETSSGNKMKGLLVNKNDSSLILFPGGSEKWKNRNSFSPGNFSDYQVESIHIHKRNSVAKGALIGLGVGFAIPLLGALVSPVNAQAFGFVAVVTVPMGPIVGAIIGASSGRKFHIGGQRKNFQDFSRKVKL